MTFLPGSKLRMGSLDKKQWDFSIGFWKIARNKVCGKRTCLINVRFVQPVNLHMSTLLLSFSNHKSSRQKQNANVML